MAPVVSSSPLPPVYHIPPLDNTLGAILIGTFLGLALYGLVVHQCYRYFKLYPDDSRWTKSLVSSTLLFETFHIVISMHICYHYLITNYASPETSLSGVWSLSLLSATTGFIVIPSQSFFARRIFLLGGRGYRVVVVLVFVLLAGELGFLCAGSAEAFSLPWLPEFQKYTWLVSVGVGLAFLADGLLTGVLVNILRKKHTGVKRMDQILETLILYTMNTGMLTGIVNLSSLLFSLFFPNNFIYVGFGIVSTKLYANSLLAALNTRKSLQYTPSLKSMGVTGSSTLFTPRRETIIFEMQGRSVAPAPKVEVVEDNQAFLTYELVGIAI